MLTLWNNFEPHTVCMSNKVLFKFIPPTKFIEARISEWVLVSSVIYTPHYTNSPTHITNNNKNEIDWLFGWCRLFDFTIDFFLFGLSEELVMKATADKNQQEEDNWGMRCDGMVSGQKYNVNRLVFCLTIYTLYHLRLSGGWERAVISKPELVTSLVWWTIKSKR